MLPIRCFTCSTIIGNRQIFYEQQMKEISNDPNIDEEEKLALKTKLVNSFNLKYCCNMRIMTFKNKAEIMKDFKK
jgi:DNA-directed RNA polymerase subunit N (RpoN/RPB10)